MAERPRPDLDRVREALRDHNEAHEDEPREEVPEAPQDDERDEDE
jgi:hypothetical protein